MPDLAPKQHNNKRKALFYRTPLTIFVLLPMLTLGAGLFYFKVSFTPQAPNGVWNQPWQDACEETSIAMVQAFYNGKTFSDGSAEQKIRDIFDIKEKYFSFSLDENAAEIAAIINYYLPWEASVVSEPTLEFIKSELDAQRPLIVVTAGKELRNSNFLNGGPDYHVFVLSGYDEDKREFIAQEPGTSQGANYRYSFSTIMEAMHDLMPNKQTATGPKVIIATSSVIKDSATLDGDADGLNKSDEIKYKTNLANSDTDQDDYKDGEEVKNGYSPTVAEMKIADVAIIKTNATPKIYEKTGKNKHYITTAKELANKTSAGQSIIVVSEKYLNQLIDE